jgi:hypothetical protein
MAILDSQKKYIMHVSTFPVSWNWQSFLLKKIKNYECLPVVVHYDPSELQILHYQEGCQQMATLNE